MKCPDCGQKMRTPEERSETMRVSHFRTVRELEKFCYNEC